MSRSPLFVKLSVQAFSVFTLLYPSNFRQKYRREMTLVFQDWTMNEWKRRRWVGLAVVWYRTIIDLLLNAVLQHVVRLREVAASATSYSRNQCMSSTSGIRIVQQQKLVVYGIGFCVLNCFLWFTTPTLRAAIDASAGRLDSPNRPYIVRGVQELLVYFDPWLAWYVFPVVFTIGFALLPFLLIPRGSHSIKTSTSLTYVWMSSRLMFSLELVWLFLIWVGVCCRGPQWNFYWPGETWDETREVALNTVNLSEYFWASLFALPSAEMPWLIREFPGILVLLTYFMLGLILVRRRWNQDYSWPLATTTIMLLLAIVIPTKMFCRVVWDLRYIVAIPELHLNIYRVRLRFGAGSPVSANFVCVGSISIALELFRTILLQVDVTCTD